MKAPLLTFFAAKTGPLAQRWRWRLVAKNGRIVASSGEGFRTRGGAEQNARLARHLLADLVS